MFVEKLAWHTYDISILILVFLLAIACIYDIRRSRIPNKLVLAGIVAGMGLHAWYFGFSGVVMSLAGLLVGSAILLVFYLIKVNGQRLMGAGDVKLMAAVGAFLGPVNAGIAVGFVLGVGAVAGVAYLFWRGALAQYLKRYWTTLKILAFTRRWVYQAPAGDDAAMQRFPYSIAIASGTLVALAHLSYLNFRNFFNLLQGFSS